MATKMAKRKPKSKDDAVMNLYHAVAKYVESKDGNVVVAGGIQCQLWPSDAPHQFTIAVKCSGSPPKYTESGESDDSK